MLSRHILMENTELYLSLIGVDSKQYSGHSYRIGGSTTMAAAGMSDWDIPAATIVVAPQFYTGFAKRMTSVP